MIYVNVIVTVIIVSEKKNRRYFFCTNLLVVLKSSAWLRIKRGYVLERRSFSYTDLGIIRIENIIKNNIQHLMTQIFWKLRPLFCINVLFNCYLLVSDYQSVTLKLHRKLESWRAGHTCVLWYSFRVSCKSISCLTFFSCVNGHMKILTP